MKLDVLSGALYRGRRDSTEGNDPTARIGVQAWPPVHHGGANEYPSGTTAPGCQAWKSIRILGAWDARASRGRSFLYWLSHASPVTPGRLATPDLYDRRSQLRDRPESIRGKGGRRWT